MKFGIIKTLKVLTTAFICLMFFNQSCSGTENKAHKLEMLDAAKNIEFFSQGIAKAYFYKQQGVRPDRAAEELQRDLLLLEKNLKTVQNGIEKDNKEEQDIVFFLEYTMNELKGIVERAYSEENGALLIDNSEALLEGADFIAQGHTYKQNAEENMFVAVEHLLFLLERINKFYIAYKAGFNNYNNIEQLKEAVQHFETTLAKINAYGKYADNSLKSRDKLNEFWPVAKEFFIDIQRGALPVIVLASVDKLENELKVLEEFHYSKAGSK